MAANWSDIQDLFSDRYEDRRSDVVGRITPGSGGRIEVVDHDPASGLWMTSVNPATEQAWCEIPNCQQDDVDAAVEAARARASVGEISMAMEKVFGRHRAEVKTLAGVYGSAYEGDEGFAAIQKDVETFAEEEGQACGPGRTASPRSLPGIGLATARADLAGSSSKDGQRSP